MSSCGRRGLCGECYGCDCVGPLDDLSLWADCAAKLDRDLIRERDWACSMTAFGVLPDKYEELRDLTIAKYGAELELIAPGGTADTMGETPKPANRQSRGARAEWSRKSKRRR